MAIRRLVVSVLDLIGVEITLKVFKALSQDPWTTINTHLCGPMKRDFPNSGRSWKVTYYGVAGNLLRCDDCH